MADPSESSAPEDPLLDAPVADRQALHNAPRRWIVVSAIGVVLVVLGLLQLLFAVQWHGDTIGLVLGAIALALGVLLTALFLRPAVGAAATRDEEADRVIHEPGKQTLADSLSHPVFVAVLVPLAIFLALRIAVHAASKDRLYDSFPSACPPGKLEGCNRVSLLAPHNNAPDHMSLEVFLVSTSRMNLETAVDGFIGSLPRTTVLKRTAEAASNSTSWHSRVTTRLWSFADDFLVRVTCMEEGDGRLSMAEMQGTLRIGKGDMEVNYYRNAALLRWLKQAKAAGDLPDEGAC